MSDETRGVGLRSDEVSEAGSLPSSAGTAMDLTQLSLETNL